MPSYLFDAKLNAAIRVTADTPEQGLAKLNALVNCCEANLGHIDGNPVVCEVSLAGDPVLAEDDLDEDLDNEVVEAPMS